MSDIYEGTAADLSATRPVPAVRPSPARAANGQGERPSGGPGERVTPVPPMPGPSIRSVEPARPVRPLLAALLAGLLIGALIGGVVSSVVGSGTSASALVEVAPRVDPGLAATQNGTASATDVTAFAASEASYLASTSFTDAVTKKLGAAAVPDQPLVVVTRVGQSSVMKFTGTGATDAAAIALAQAGVTVYTDRRAAEFKADVAKALKGIDATLQQIGAPPVPPETSTDQQTRIDRLLAQQADLLLLSNRAPTQVEVLEPAALDDPSGPTWLLGAVLGGVLGALLGLAAVQTIRTRRPAAVAATGDLDGVVDHVLFPEVSLRRDWPATTPQKVQADDLTTARLLVAQISQRRPMGGRVIAVVGPSPDSASGVVSAMIAVGAAEQTPTVLVGFDTPQGSETDSTPAVAGLEHVTLDPSPDARAALDESWKKLLEAASSGRRCVVVDVGTSADALRLLPASSEPVLVLGAGVDSQPAAVAAALAVRSGQGRLLGVLTRRSWSPFMLWSGSASTSSSVPAPVPAPSH